jgi:hypothetical protein
MGPVGYVIAIMGCADGSAACQQLAVMPARYESQAACAAATSDVLANSSEFDAPTIVAQCQAVKTSPAAETGPAKRPKGVAVRNG